MPIPFQPADLVPRPFASDGTYKVLPESKPASGRASYESGFPEETQLPLSHGGVAPNRMDLNGILHLLTSFAFWQQSGGQWTWKDTLNYSKPGLVCHKDGLWWCMRDSGPETPLGPVEPGTDTGCWEEFLAHLFNSGTLKLKDATPVGTVISYYGLTAPEGYLECDGRGFSASAYPRLYALLGRAATPDLRGSFIRGYDAAGGKDPDGRSRGIGSAQNDAGRNITGTFTALLQTNSDIRASGAFSYTNQSISEGGPRERNPETPIYNLDASRSWGAAHTASEFRPYNISLLYCIKHDELE